MAWVTPKTNWNTNDFYNFTDFNRVESNTIEICDFVDSFDFRPQIGSTKTDWDNKDIPFFDDLNRIEQNIAIIRNTSSAPEGWTAPKTNWNSLDGFDFNDANRLERNLVQLYDMFANIKKAVLFCGTFSCGGGNTAL
jgi:hypothetical protein